MSYHMHNKREEVWTVVSGKGKTSPWLQSVKEKCVVVPNCINVERMKITPEIEKRAVEI